MSYSRFLLVLMVFLGTMCSDLLAQTDTAELDPARFEQEIETFANWDAKNSSPENAILFVGSSSIRFWDTAEAFPNYPVINRGFGGSHISDVLHYYDRVIGRFDPSLIVFYCGENDIASGLNPDKVFDSYLSLLSQINQSFPDVDFLYVSIKPSGSRLEHTEQFEAFNQRIKAHNQSSDQLHYIDLASVLTSNDGPPDDALFVKDRLHLNEDGYELWNNKMTDFLSDFR